MVHMRTQRITAKAFAVLAKDAAKKGVKPGTIALAKLALVDGQPIRKIGKDYGKSFQRVQQCVEIVMRGQTCDAFMALKLQLAKVIEVSQVEGKQKKQLLSCLTNCTEGSAQSGDANSQGGTDERREEAV